jgi:hypothetical protein
MTGGGRITLKSLSERRRVWVGKVRIREIRLENHWHQD